MEAVMEVVLGPAPVDASDRTPNATTNILTISLKHDVIDVVAVGGLSVKVWGALLAQSAWTLSRGEHPTTFALLCDAFNDEAKFLSPELGKD
jgi:hypothetical protein